MSDTGDRQPTVPFEGDESPSGGPIVRELSVTFGADLEIDLSFFPEDDPLFGYVDDTGRGVEPLSGVDVVGRRVIGDQPDFMWLKGDRDCVLLRVNDAGKQEGRVVVRTLGLGEFCLQIFHIAPDESVKLIHQCDYIFK